MQLPNADQVTIARDKIIHYLLSKTHPIGKAKAKFFTSHGFSLNQPEVLEESLKKLAIENAICECSESPYGKKYLIKGKIMSPSKKELKLSTVWIIEPHSATPSFVTAFPC